MIARKTGCSLCARRAPTGGHGFSHNEPVNVFAWYIGIYTRLFLPWALFALNAQPQFPLVFAEDDVISGDD
jgi:hypothetical protein